MKLLVSGKQRVLFSIAVGLTILYYFSLPDPLFRDSYSTVLEDKNGHLLSASIAADGQWRFPKDGKPSDKFVQAITFFEDRRFWSHPGIDILALGRAIRQNIQAGEVVSGGSTLTMQVIRLSRHNPPRTVLQKVWEVILATRLELRCSKAEILSMYAAHAPFGGNVVGIEAACRRYFGRGSAELSWSEAALLAVLPNNPSLIHLARNRDVLRRKRDRLLQKLHEAGLMDVLGFQLALAEPIPDRPYPLPQVATHLLDRAVAEGRQGQIVRTTVDGELQVRVERAVADYGDRLKANRIFNAAVLVLEVSTGKTLAYVGNAASGNIHHERVDIIRSRRSTGSILKPFLFAAMLEEGKMLSRTLQPDVPTLIGGFAPKNFSLQFDGAVPADQALIRSLNVPTVYELKEYRYEKFYNLLQSLGMTTLQYPPDHYGLSLVLGGAEGTLWDITGMYASATRKLNNYFDRPGSRKYAHQDIHPPVYIDSRAAEPVLEESAVLQASSWWLTLETLKELYRPGEESGWRHFQSSKTIAWKTGTSYGFRDGWAVGVTPHYAVGVWVGNASGEGRPGLTGTEAAAPLMFDVFGLLPAGHWFQKPLSELSQVVVCAASGQRATTYCEGTDTVEVTQAGLSSLPCSFHRLIHVTSDQLYRVHGDCIPLDQVSAISWFILPPIQEYYYRSRNLSYRSLPPYRPGCEDPTSTPSLELIYPKPNARIYLPILMDGRAGSTVFEATHRNKEAKVYWHLDGHYLGITQATHRLAVYTGRGRHTLTLVDEFGESLKRVFDVISP